MFKRKTKPQAPLRQLRESAKVAHGMLVKRGVVFQENVLEEFAKEANAPILPGLPSYLPHKFTINASRGAMYILLKEWSEMTKEELERQDRSAEFFAFVVKRMHNQDRKFKKESDKIAKTLLATENQEGQGPTLYEVFSPLKRYQTTKSLNKFFVDSFAVFTIVKGNGSTTDYTEWFLGDWTPSLLTLWTAKENGN